MTRDELREEVRAIVDEVAGYDIDRMSDEVLAEMIADATDRILSIPKIAEGIGMVVVKDISDVIPLS
jgi:hypothetical protein